MANTNDFIPFATGVGANVQTPATWAANPTVTEGFVNGTAEPYEANTALRQATSIASMIAGFTADFGPGNVQDNGDIATLKTQFEAALTQYFQDLDSNILPTAVAPLTTTDTTIGGWIHRVFGIAIAGKPAGTTSGQEAAAFGVGRAATDAEFAAGAPESGAAVSWPWATLQQIKAAFAGYLPLSGGSMTGLLKAASGLAGGVITLNSSASLATADTGKLIQLTGTTSFTTTLPTPIADGGAFNFFLNNSTAIQTISASAGAFFGVGQPSGGASTLSLDPGKGVLLWSDSYNWEVVVISGKELCPPQSKYFYVACNSGNDSNPGASGTPFKTLSGAINTISSKFFSSEIDIILSESGDYPGVSISPSSVSFWNIYPASGVNARIVAWDSTTNLGRGLTGSGPCSFEISNVSYGTMLENVGVSSGASVTINNCALIMASGAFALGSYSGASMKVYQGNTISGSGQGLALVTDASIAFGYQDSVTTATCSVNAVGNPTFTSACINAQENAVVKCYSGVATFSGSANGPRYVGYNGSRFSTFGAGPNYLLGSTSGSVDSQSSYT